MLALLLGGSYVAQAFYDPTVGRWINRDPIGERGGKNLYRFVNNNPAIWVDPDGLRPIFPPGTSQEFMRHWQQVYDSLRDTPTGQKLMDACQQKEIIICPRPTTAGGTGGSNDPIGIVGLHRTDPLGVGDGQKLELTFFGQLPPAPAVTLGHELGHACGAYDPANVRDWENPLRRDLGYPPREAYRWEPIPPKP